MIYSAIRFTNSLIDSSTAYLSFNLITDSSLSRKTRRLNLYINSPRIFLSSSSEIIVIALPIANLVIILLSSRGKASSSLKHSSAISSF